MKKEIKIRIFNEGVVTCVHDLWKGYTKDQLISLEMTLMEMVSGIKKELKRKR